MFICKFQQLATQHVFYTHVLQSIIITTSAHAHCLHKSQMYILYPLQNINAVSQALSMPPTTVLAGLLTIVSFSMSHSIVKVDESELCESVLLWISIFIATGCAKSSLHSYLHKLMNKACKSLCWIMDHYSVWVISLLKSLVNSCRKITGKFQASTTNCQHFYHRSIVVVVEPWLIFSKCQHFSNCMKDVSGSAEQV